LINIKAPPFPLEGVAELFCVLCWEIAKKLQQSHNPKSVEESAKKGIKSQPSPKDERYAEIIITSQIES